jgi:hypothetical protein
MRGRAAALVAGVCLVLAPTGARAQLAPHHSWNVLSFTNGFSAHDFDTQLARVKSFREHLYDHHDASTPTIELAYDTYFGLRDAGHDAWLGETPIDDAAYVPGTGIVRVVQHVGALQATAYYFAPFALEAPAMVMAVAVTNTGPTAETDGAVFSIHNFHTGDGSAATGNEQITWDGNEYAEQGTTTGRTMVYVPLPAPTHYACTPNNPYTAVEGGGHLVDTATSGVTTDAVAGYELDLTGLAPGATRWFGVLVGYAPSAGTAALLPAMQSFIGGRSVDAIEAAEESEWQAWHAGETRPAGLSSDEAEVYAQSTAILRMGQVREPSPTDGSPGPEGQIVASLPPGIWDMTWVRDQSLATLALVRAGHVDEARAALTFILHAKASGYVCCDLEGGPYVGVPYTVSVVRYTGGGVEESDSNAQGPNIEFDGFGLTLLAADAYVAASDDTAFLQAAATPLLSGDADVLVGLIEPSTGLLRADSSIWEEHWEMGGRKHFLDSDATAVAGLRAAADLAARLGMSAKQATYRAAADGLANAIAAKLTDAASGALMANLEEPNDWVDAAVVDAFNLDVVEPRDATASATLDTLRQRLFLGFTGHGYMRTDDGGSYDDHEWLVCDLRIATALRRDFRDSQADDLLSWVTEQARANYDLVPENYDQLSADYTGQVPMVGFGAGAYILALHDRADELAVRGRGEPHPRETTVASATPTQPMTPPARGEGCSIAQAGGATGGDRPGARGLLSAVLALCGLVAFGRRRRRNGRRISVAAAATMLLATSAFLPACGFEVLFEPPTGYNATPPPRARLSLMVDDVPPSSGGTPAPFAVSAYDTDGTVLGTVSAVPGTAATLDLGVDRDLENVRLAARRGDVVLRAIAPSVPRTKAANPTVLGGTVGNDSTAASILVERKLEPGGLGSVPAPVVAKLLSDIVAPDPKRDAFRTLVGAILNEGDPTAAATAPGPFDPTGDGDLSAAYLAAHADSDPTHAPPAFAAARDQAAATLTVDITCDPAFVRVLFTADLSGRAKDGEGSTQVIRQPPKDGSLYLGITVDPSSSVADAAGALPAKIIPNNPSFRMVDDGTQGDEVAGDQIYSLLLTLPRGLRVIYKYTDGAAGDGFSGTEEWPGNARILEVDDVLTSHADGSPDCLVIRRDSFGDEASNKNFVNLNPALASAGGALGWDVDLGGPSATPASGGTFIGGLALTDPENQAPLTPSGVPEARENGVCTRCPAPLVLTASSTPPVLVSAAFDSTTTVDATFSEGLDFGSAEDPSHYLILDEAQQILPITQVAASGQKVLLTVAGPDFRAHYTLHVQGLVDASLSHNPIATGAQISINPDTTPPTPLSARSASLKDFNPAATLPDPTVGQGVVVHFDEQLDPISAQDATRYAVASAAGVALGVQAAYLTDPTDVFLITDAQGKGTSYAVTVNGVRDFAGNLETSAPPLAFKGFALYQVEFGVVPGFAFASLDGSQRGLPAGEGLYLTGTPLAQARDAAGEDISVSGRTDVTGVPEFAMLPSTDPTDQVGGQPVYRLSILLPPGVYAWKPAHGQPGEWTHPPVTLEKVEKALATTNDATAVAVDPRTLVARDGTSYAGAILSADGRDAPGPRVLFKRENPDEICVVSDANVTCPTVIVGTWRDLQSFYVAGKLDDYDDGQITLDPLRDVPDTAPPRLLALLVRDSESILLSFDKAVVPAPAGATFSAADSTGAALSIVQSLIGQPTPHEVFVQTAPQGLATSYTLTIGGLSDPAGNAFTSPLTATWVSPPTSQPFTPLDDHSPAAVTAVIPVSPTGLKVTFSKAIAAASASPGNFAIGALGASSPPPVLAVSLTGAGKIALVTTGAQTPAEPYSLTVTNISDLSSPPNVLTSATIDFAGFGDTTPPMLKSAWSMGPTQVGLRFSKDLDALSADVAANYSIAGLTVTGVEFSGDPTVVASAFDGLSAPFVRDLVVLDTTPQTAGMSYTVQATGVRDLSGNVAMSSAAFSGLAQAPTVTLDISYLISTSNTVNGLIPPRAISPLTLSTQREGVFILGSAVSTDGTMVSSSTDPVTMQLGGFPPEGAPITGPVPALQPDSSLGSGWYTITVTGVPLGTTVEWKAFASYSVAYKNANPGDPAAAFANAAPGPSAFADGQEYPGNEDGLRVIGDLDGDGKVAVQVLFGDETTYKKLTGHSAFVWTTDSFTWTP